MPGFSTRAIRAATRAPHVDQIPSNVPIYQAAAFSTADAAELGDVLTGATPGYAYSRIDNPTTAALGNAVAELEGAEAGLAFASGMAATHCVSMLLEQGDHIVAGSLAEFTGDDAIVVGVGLALYLYAFAPIVGFHWGVGGDANLLDAGDRVESVFDGSIEGFHLRGGVARCLRVEMDDVSVRRVELEIYVPELIQALDKHACSDQQHQGESRLQHDEAALQQ